MGELSVSDRWCLSRYLGAVITTLLVLGLPVGAEEERSFEIPEFEKPFWESAQAFVDAHAERDAEKIGQLFTEDVEFYDEFGKLTEGRQALIESFQEVFVDDFTAKVEGIRIDRVKPLSEGVALEEGTVTTSDDGIRRASRYIAVHVKESDGQWRIKMLKDYAQERLTRREQLDQLTWLVGEWVSEEGDVVVRTSCQWSEDGNFLLRRFSTEVPGLPAMNGVQRIGWDPVRREIRSWVFDSNGGFFEGRWTPVGNQWIIRSTGVTANGRRASATAIYTVVDQEMITWGYRDLVIGDELQADLEPVMMVRRPPAPKTAEK